MMAEPKAHGDALLTALWPGSGTAASLARADYSAVFYHQLILSRLQFYKASDGCLATAVTEEWPVGGSRKYPMYIMGDPQIEPREGEWWKGLLALLRPVLGLPVAICSP